MSQIYLGEKLIASTEGSDIKYDENTSVKEKIDELNSNLNNEPTLLTTVTSFTNDGYKSISAISDWSKYKELIFVARQSYGDEGEEIVDFVEKIDTSIIFSNMIFNVIPFVSFNVGTEVANVQELKVKFLSTGKMSVYSYYVGNYSIESLKIYGR